MKVLYLFHGRNAEQLEHSKYATTVDYRIDCDPDIVLDLCKDLNIFDKIFEDNTYDLIETRWAPFEYILNNHRLIQLCYKKLKVGGKLYLNNVYLQEVEKYVRNTDFKIILSEQQIKGSNMGVSLIK